MNTALEQIATVIDLTNKYEIEINLVLSQCIVPVSSEYGFLCETLFHNLCLGFGCKVRLLRRIIEYWNWKDEDMGSFYAVMELRNAFAHTSTSKRVLLIGFDPQTYERCALANEMVVDRKYKTYWKEVERGQALTEYMQAHGEATKTLKRIAEKIALTISPKRGASAVNIK